VTDDLSTALPNERTQLLETGKRVFAKTPNPCVARFLQLDRLAKGPTDKKAISNDLRKFHDRFGWMAKESSSAGKCAGALYRTQAFIQLPSDERIGKKRGQTVHIEHTVPVNVLSMRWLEVRKGGQEQELMPTFAWVMHHTVATAFHQDERMSLKGVSKSTDCFAEGAPGFGRPFKRYSGLFHQGGQVWDVYNGALIEPDLFSLSDHFANVVALAQEAGAAPQFIAALKASSPD